MYVGYAADGAVWFASEMKALIDDCEKVEVRDENGGINVFEPLILIKLLF